MSNSWSLIGFPDTVNEKAARAVAAGVAVLSIATVATQQRWLLVPLVYGFWARLLTGPRLSPLGQLATRIAAPRLGPKKPVPGSPKRFAQGIGVVFSSTAAILWIGVGSSVAASLVLSALAAAATLEAVAGLCIGCKAFALLMRAGVLPGSACRQCSDLSWMASDSQPVSTGKSVPTAV